MPTPDSHAAPANAATAARFCASCGRAIKPDTELCYFCGDVSYDENPRYLPGNPDWFYDFERERRSPW